jgi:hypothetical protein
MSTTSRAAVLLLTALLLPTAAPAQVVEVPFRRTFLATDLVITRFTAEIVGDHARFELNYSSGRDRFLSCFDPPSGAIVRHLDRSALRHGQGAVAFTLPLDQLRAATALTVLIASADDARADRNLLFLNLSDPAVRPIFGDNAGRPPHRRSIATARSGPVAAVQPFDNIRWKDASAVTGLTPDIIRTLEFNERTRWSAPDAATSRLLLQRAKDPGLGIRGLHRSGITGAGVTVGIVDQNLLLDHPEFRDRIAGYKDVGCKASGGSMHAPAVTSLLVGRNIGTAPGARVYFAAAPSWTRDAKYQADALNWLLDVNESLPPAERIRVVSISAAPSGSQSPFTRNGAMYDAACERAWASGVLVLDCTGHRGIISACYYDLDAPDDLWRVKPGYPGLDYTGRPGRLLVPASPRTVAEEYVEGDCGYTYTGRGGLSWAIPYAAGVLALGWQVNPALPPARMVALLRQTAHRINGRSFINPVAFVEAVRKE